MVAAGALVSACGDDRFRRGDENAIVFGVAQRVDPATGASEVAASYELLRFRGRGFEVEDGRVPGSPCDLEDLSARRGSGLIESGRAAFTGGTLPADGLVVLASAKEPVVAKGATWRAGDMLGFAASGFAIPELGAFRFRAPSPTLDVRTPVPGPSPLRASEDLVVTWVPPDRNGPSANDEVSAAARGDAVMVVLNAGPAPGIELRCFFGREAGTGIVPRAELAAFRARASAVSSIDGGAPSASDARDAGVSLSSGLSGTLAIATQRQVTFAGRGGWILYVVASAEARTQPFTLAAE